MLEATMTKTYIDAWVDATHPIINSEGRQFSKAVVGRFIATTIRYDVLNGNLICDQNLCESTDAMFDGLDRKIASEFSVISFFAQSFKETLPNVVTAQSQNMTFLTTQKLQCPSERDLG